MRYPSGSNVANKGYIARIGMLGQIHKLVSRSKDFLNSVPDRIFDRSLGVSTREIVIMNSSVFSGSGENCNYRGSQWLPVRRVLKNLRPGPSDIFVDLGSGKGKVLLIAGRLPYRRVIGVEVDAELSECSRHNIQQARPRLRTRDVGSITASVLDWPIPDETSVVFIFNSFIGQTFRTAVRHIIESYDRRPRMLHIIYYYPWEHNWLLSTSRVIVDDVRPGDWLPRPRWWQTGNVIVSYRVVGASEGIQFGSAPRSMIRPYRAKRRWSRPNDQVFTMSAKGWETRYSSS